MSDAGPMRRTNDLADMVELLLDKGIVINADIAVTIGETELLSVKVRAAIASFETAAQYGLEFPDGTDPDRLEAAASQSRGIDAGSGGTAGAGTAPESGDEAPDRSTEQMGTRPSGTGEPAIRPHQAEDDDDED